MAHFSSIIIVNWNSGPLLKKCLRALSVQTIKPLDVVVVDNKSEDDSLKEITEEYPTVSIVVAEKNLGFAAANNLGIQFLSPECQWVALLNPDAFPEPTWLESLEKAATQYKEYSFFGSRLIDANNPAVLDGEGDVCHISGLVWRSNHGEKRDNSNCSSVEIFSPCAAAAMYRKDVFLEAGGFDEDFFCYIEDVDLGFRMRLLGHRCLYVPDSVALHVGSAVTGRRSDFSIYHGHRNLVWAYIKNMPGMLFWLCLPLHLALTLFSILYFSFKGQAQVISRAKWDALKGIPKMWRKRQEIQSRRIISARDIWRLLDKHLIPIRRS